MGVLAAVLVGGCAANNVRSASVSPPDPSRWERAACQRGEYPVELDGKALTRARYADLRTRQSGEYSSFAVARLKSDRDEFDVRCAAWLAERGTDVRRATDERVGLAGH
jgi:hypothetical protein